jgi:hypothetical protein
MGLIVIHLIFGFSAAEINSPRETFQMAASASVFPDLTGLRLAFDRRPLTGDKGN